MRFSELTGFSVPPAEDGEIAGITCDSRRVEPGFVFVCISGTAVDGHDYAAGALEKGAAAVITERPLGLPREWTVESTRKCWAHMCACWFGHPAEKLKLIGVTGTNGKTTVTWLLKSVLEACGEKVGLVGTIQNMIGERVLPSGHTTPDSYDLQSLLALMVAEGCTYAVMEVSSHALCQERVEGCRFDAAVFTNLTQDHLDYHGTMEAYMQAKKRLFLQADCGIFNADDPWTPRLREGLSGPQYGFSANGAADFSATEIHRAADGVAFRLNTADGAYPVRLNIPGGFSVYNALAALSCLLVLGFDPAAVTTALAAAHGVRGRAELVPCDRGFSVVIDYAHTPDGLENICRTLKECCAGRLITVFGCGGDRDRGKRPKMGRIAAQLSDLLVVTSDNPRSEEPKAIIRDILVGVQEESTPYEVVENRPQAIRRALELAAPGDTVLLAGKGHETYQVLVHGTVHLDEREVVAEALRGV